MTTDSLFHISPIPAFSDNYIWLIEDKQNTQRWVVDPGSAEAVIDYFEEHQLNGLAGILITHHHFDHTGGISKLVAYFGKIPVFGPSNPSIKGITHQLEDGDRATLSEALTLDVITVPGHTLDHIAYFTPGLRCQAENQVPTQFTQDETRPVLFCGDTLFSAGCGRLFEGTASQMRRSLQKLRNLPESTLVFCTHEYTTANLDFARAAEPDNPTITQHQAYVKQRREQGQPSLPTTIQLEKRINPFLRWDSPSIISLVSMRSGTQIKSADTIFSEIRSWKDNF
ncbi:hydroxyacylglutathione hydrolase [Marinibactrum halimedae]|uniref:Hydroxyacylglutathione hydrolase n=1 Tax=Marinibactrum halimedae TaxID=1444977 RepID=A0AA37T6J5_9GAMM|nr:hydroxyacylglutathione hydrolase [Marinibactrum halimedae]MCD9461079.1 hydroxyacylglutathione hydrolase [Marinibactrum halimedae]GLS26746.1 hydroxyacylglutathione hydrolase [Marinibactrum halimedae]